MVINASIQPTPVPFYRKLLIPVFLFVCVNLGLSLSGWAIAESINGLTRGQWQVNTLTFQLVMITYAITGILSTFAAMWWFIRAILLRGRRAPIWTDPLLTRLFAVTAVSFTIMNIVHLWSEVLTCNAGLVADCSF